MLFKSICGCFCIALTTVSCQRSGGECSKPSYVHSYGVEVAPEQWDECGRNGQVIFPSQNGVTVSQSFEKGVLNGESTYTFPNSSQIEVSEWYKNNALVKETLYSQQGIPNQTTEFIPPDTRVVTTWYAPGNPKSVEKFTDQYLISGEYYTIQNERDSWVYDGSGERFTRDPEGNFYSLDNFEHGEMVMQTMYHPNRNPRECAQYANGVLHGERRTFYENGEPMAIENWHNGQQSGMTIVFQNGQKYAEIPYLANHKNGLERRFSGEEVLSQEITWMDGKMHGPTYTYTGDEVMIDWFYKGRLTSRANFESYVVPKFRW